MSTPIDPTPRLAGEDAERLRRDLTNVCDPDEARRRIEWARRQVLALMRPKRGNDLRRCAR